MFGLPPEEVGKLTYHEFDVLMLKHNERMKDEYEMQRNVFLNAINNAFRKKNMDIIPLFSEENEGKTVEEILEERRELFGE